MSAALASQPGSSLTTADYSALEARWITRDLAHAAMLGRVDSLSARDMLGRKGGNLAGIAIPNVLPGSTFARETRVRLDEFADNRKYLSPVGRPNLAYFPPAVPPELLASSDMPVVVCEGEFKTLAMWRLANHESEAPRFMPMGFPGVWAFRGTVGKTSSAKGERIDQKGIIADVDRLEWTGRKVVIAFDADITVKEQVQIARAHLARELRSRGAKVAFLEWDIAEGKGIDDRLAKVGPEKVLADIAALDFERRDWRANLISNREGEPRALLANAITALREAPEWSGVLAHNEFSQGTATMKRTPWGERPTEWSDHDDRLTADWLQHKGIYVSVEIAGQAVQSVAKDRCFHPVREYLVGLEWDGVKRIQVWLREYLGAEDSQYSTAVGARWLISAAARILEPGCKADCCLILEGAQGILKSTALKTIAGDWFTDEIAELGSKDAAMQTRGVWIIEIAELDSMSRADVSKIKGFMSRTTDRFRPPYGKRLIESPRQCVFAGSVNESAYLRDATGGRRFWPATCAKILIDDLRRDRDQLWAEAVASFKAGTPWWLDSADLNLVAEREQFKRYSGDAWDDVIQDWLASRDSVSVSDILTVCIDKDRSTWTQSDQNRVARSLKHLGWKRFQVRDGGIQQWKYKRP